MVLHIVDMGDVAAVARLARSLVAAQTPLHVLVNNAGCMVDGAADLPSGLEPNFAVNVAGVVALTELLLPYLAAQADPRVITVASGGLLLERLEPVDIQLRTRFAAQPFSAETAYAQHKRQQAVLTRHWATTHPAVGCYCMHPGWVDTPALRNSMPDFHRRFERSLRTPSQGADTVLWLALAPRAKLVSGEFYRDRRPESLHLFGGGTRETAANTAEYLATLQRTLAPLLES